jgi:hypothetical protein
MAAVQAFHYFKMYPGDSLVRKSLIWASLFFCAISLVGDYGNT